MSALTDCIYDEVQTTNQTFVHDLREAILQSASWAKINPTAALVSTTANASAGATTLTFSSGATAAAGIGVGSVIRVGASGAADCEYRTVVGQTATTLTFSGQAMTYAHASGTQIFDGHEVLKCTNSDGVDMIIDLMDSHIINPTLTQTSIALYQSHDGTSGTDKLSGYLKVRTASAADAAAVARLIVSVSKEHLFITSEAGRPGETGGHANWFPQRSCTFITRVVPYHASDATPAIYASIRSNTSASYTSNLDFYGRVSENVAGTDKWVPATLATLQYPTLANLAPNLQRNCVHDGNYYLSPYVIFEGEDGIRGRLETIWNAGWVSALQEIPGTPAGAAVVGSVLEYDSQDFIITQPYRGGPTTGTDTGGDLGYAATNSYDSNQLQHVLVAIPHAT